MIGNTRKIGIFVFLTLFLAGYTTAQCLTGHLIEGNAIIATSLAPAGGTVNITGSVSGFSQTANIVSGAPNYAATFTANDSCSGGFVNTDTLTYYVNGNVATATSDCPTTYIQGAVMSGTCNLTISASCTDGIMNGAEVLTDCGGGTCGACLTGGTASLSADTSENATTNVTGTFTVASGASASGSTPALAVTITSGNLVGTTNSSDIISASNVIVNASSFTLTKGQTHTILLTVLMPANSTDTYTGQLNITTNESAVNGTVSTTLTVSSGIVIRRSRKYMDVAVTGVDTEGVCVNQQVMVVVTDQRRNKAVDRADVDVFMNKDKVFNLDSDSKGQAKFTPTKTGDYLLQIDASGYRRYEETITVEACGYVEPEATTTVEEVTETTIEVAETTIAAPETTIEAPETTVAQVTTVAPPTTVPVAPAKKGSGTLIIIVIVVIIIIAAVAMSKKGGGGDVVAEAPKEAAPPEGK